MGYATGIFGDSIIYVCFYTYFMIFLTDVVGINPVLAGTMSLVSVCVDAITDPIMGWLLDRPGINPKKFMLYGGICECICIAFLFFPVGGGDVAKFIFYVSVTSLMWVAYTCYAIPYYAIVPRLTQNYDEQTQLRGWAGAVNALANYTGGVAPIVVVTILAGSGMEYGRSWWCSGALMGVIALVFVLTNYFSIKDVELIKVEAHEGEKAENIFKTYGNILKLKPLWILLIFVILFTLSNVMVTSNQTYLLIYCAGSSADALSTTTIFSQACFLIVSPIVSRLSAKWDRKVALFICFTISVIGQIAMKFVGIDSVVDVYVLCIFCGIGLAGYWTLFYSFCYDMAALDTYKSGKDRTGSVTAIVNFFFKAANAVGLQIFGIVLAMTGYDAAAEVQSQSAVNAIESISSSVVGILMAVCLAVMVFYPVTKKVYEKLTIANEKQKKGEAFHQPELDKIVK